MTPDISYPFNAVLNKGTSYEEIDLKSTAFFNLNKGSYLKEAEEAELSQVTIAKKGTEEFKAILETKMPVKWVYTIYRELYIMIENWGGYDITHAALARGKPVFTAGFGEWNEDKFTINNWTGHYKVTKESFNYHYREAWRGSGIEVVPGDLINNKK